VRIGFHFRREEICKERVLIEVKKLLCVDDSTEMLNFLVEFLESEFVIVGTLSSGSSVVAAAANLNPDIILLDVDLGDTNGFLVAEQLRRSGCRAKIVFLSVHTSLDFIEAAKALGAAAYVPKSQIGTDLVKTLHNVM
jgi:DNA-binding NarL/FixJ family response regulator